MKRNTITKQDLIAAKYLLSPYKVKLDFHPYLEGGGCLPNTKLIIIGLKNDKKTFYSVLCHELGHILAFENKDYLDYHDSRKFIKLSKKRKKYISWEAEKYVDKLGEKIFNKFNLNHLGFEYEKSYNDIRIRPILWEMLGINYVRK